MLVCVDHDEVTVVVAYGEQADVAGPRAQLEHRPGGDETEQARGPTRLGCRPGARLENAPVVGDLELINAHGAHDRVAGCALLRSRRLLRPSHLVSAIAPRRRRGVSAPAHGTDRSRGRVHVPRVVDDGVNPVHEHRATRAQRDIGMGEPLGSFHRQGVLSRWGTNILKHTMCDPVLQVQAGESAEEHVVHEVWLLGDEGTTDGTHSELLVHGVGLHVLVVVVDE